ncbi:MAG: pseudaminic acid synthase [Myxococcaceae bacterium]|nr:pseudaminic acid synthase [Myxococcaceae bacterium]MCA3012341.1 pseudaminic acid synthase [Myxococcaceae bacterium]
MPGFSIGQKRVADDAPVYFVAELSANHGQSLDKALETVAAAAKAGADAIKLQTYTPDTLTLKSEAPPFVVKTKNAWAGRTLHDLYAEAMTPWEWHRNIMQAAGEVGLACFSTPFDATAVRFLAELEVPAYKVASFEVTDLPLVEAMARQGRPMIISSGMASLAEVEAAVRICHEAGNRDVAVLRCVSAYPADPRSMDLRSLEVLRGLGVVLGLSDHTRDNVAAITAVALGARFIEKHFIVDRSWGGPDAFFSLEPSEFRSLVDDVRTCEAALGHPRFGPSVEEQNSVAFRRSLFVAREVAPGQVLTCDDIRSVRPSNGLAPHHLPAVLGRTASRPLKAAEPVSWDMVGAVAPLPAVTLRPATAADSAVLLAWRNDADTRAQSRRTGVVERSEHEAWLDQTLSSQNRRLFIAESGGVAVGQVRLDRNGPSTAEVSFTVAPEARGRGLAAALLKAAEGPAREWGTRTLLAEIRTNNERSIRAFKRVGYYGFVERARAEGSFIDCERRIGGYGS